MEKQIKNNFTLYFVHVKDGEKIIYVPKIQNDTFICLIYYRKVGSLRWKRHFIWILSTKENIYYSL